MFCLGLRAARKSVFGGARGFELGRGGLFSSSVDGSMVISLLLAVGGAAFKPGDAEWSDKSSVGDLLDILATGDEAGWAGFFFSTIVSRVFPGDDKFTRPGLDPPSGPSVFCEDIFSTVAASSIFSGDIFLVKPELNPSGRPPMFNGCTWTPGRGDITTPVGLDMVTLDTGLLTDSESSLDNFDRCRSAIQLGV
jgi:hypothetical protein